MRIFYVMDSKKATTGSMKSLLSLSIMLLASLAASVNGFPGINPGHAEWNPARSTPSSSPGHSPMQSPSSWQRGSTVTTTLKSTTQLQAAIAPHLWTSLLPPFLGLYRSEYTVSLGYGFGVALSALSLLNQFGPSPLVTLHASALVFYGFRLNAFLLLRNILSKRVQEFNYKNEERAVARGNRFVTRIPLILSCGSLYYGLAIPLWFTGKLVSNTSSIPSWAVTLLKTLMGIQWLGYGMGALGDLTKTYVKQSQRNEKYLVTSGIFSKIRHPNYTGEILAWTANALVGLVAASLWIPNGRPSVTTITNMGMLALGWVGIVFVLLQATSNLEARQKKEYSEQPKYRSWVESSWVGWQLPPKDATEEDDHATPHIEPDEAPEEESGTGI